jgi:hypothetical protein
MTVSEDIAATLVALKAAKETLQRSDCFEMFRLEGLDDLIEHIEETTCPGCGVVEGTREYGTVGDGFDGYCPSCADKREAEGKNDG